MQPSGKVKCDILIKKFFSAVLVLMDPMEDDIPDDDSFDDDIEDIEEDDIDEIKDEDDLERPNNSTVIEDFSTTLLRLNETKTTPPILTKYERTMVLGVRVKQLQLGAKSTVDTKNCSSEVEIAKKELNEKKMPLLIKRAVSPTQIEYWRLRDLQIE